MVGYRAGVVLSMHLQLKIAIIQFLALACKNDRVRRNLRAKELRKNNPEQYEAHKKKVLADYWKNRDQKLKYQNQWASKNRDRNIANAVRSIRSRSARDPRYYIAQKLNGLVCLGLSKGKSPKRFESVVGCSISEAKNHFEKKFKDGMNWSNRGVGGWDVDHIIPWKKFDLTKEEDQKRCYHITNLQPLWHGDNVRKRDRIQETTQLT